MPIPKQQPLWPLRWGARTMSAFHATELAVDSLNRISCVLMLKTRHEHVCHRGHMRWRLGDACRRASSDAAGLTVQSKCENKSADDRELSELR